MIHSLHNPSKVAVEAANPYGRLEGAGKGGLPPEVNIQLLSEPEFWFGNTLYEEAYHGALAI
jgi:hypothetical protein